MKFLRWLLRKRLQIILTALVLAGLVAVNSSARFDPGLPTGTDSTSFTTATVIVSTAATLVLASGSRNYHTFYSTYTDCSVLVGSSAQTCDFIYNNADFVNKKNTAAYYMKVNNAGDAGRAYMYIEVGK